MKTWNKPTVNELDVMMTMGGHVGSESEAELRTWVNADGKTPFRNPAVYIIGGGNGLSESPNRNARWGAAHS